jgi:hypothetical protein
VKTRKLYLAVTPSTSRHPCPFGFGVLKSLWIRPTPMNGSVGSDASDPKVAPGAQGWVGLSLSRWKAWSPFPDPGLASGVTSSKFCCAAPWVDWMNPGTPAAELRNGTVDPVQTPCWSWKKWKRS